MSKIVRLLSVGEIGKPVAGEAAGDSAFLDRPVRIVYTGKFESMDGPVEVTDDHITKLAENHNARHAELTQLAGGKEIDPKDCPPIQLDHSTSAAVTVGRLVGKVEARKATVDGKEVMALFGTARTLGKENVEKVKDGRWCTTSMGADLDTCRLNELSYTPFPAAPGSSLLSKGVRMAAKREIVEELEANGYKFKIVHVIPEDPKVAAHYTVDGLTGLDAEFGDPLQAKAAAENLIKREINGKKTKLSSEGEPVVKEKLKKHLMEHHKLSEQEADDKLSKMDDEGQKNLAAEVDEHEKKMAAAADEESKKKLSAAREGFAKLSTGFKSTAASARLALKKQGLAVRLSGLRAKAKITPAEIKKLDIDKLAAKSDGEISAFFEGYENREDVIHTGVHGSSKAVTAAELARLAKVKEKEKLEEETVENMPSVKNARLAAKKAKGDTDPNSARARLSNYEDVKSTPEPTAGGGPQIEGQGHQELMKHLTNAHACMEAGQHEEAKAHMKLCMEHAKKMAADGVTDGPTDDKGNAERLSALTESVTQMEAKFGELIALAGPVLGIET